MKIYLKFAAGLFLLVGFFTITQSAKASSKEVIIKDNYTGKGIDSVLVRVWHNEALIDSVYTNVHGQTFVGMATTGVDGLFSADPVFRVSAVFPNPFRDQTVVPIHIQEAQILHATLYDIRGCLLIQQKFDALPRSMYLNINIRNYPPGVYLLNIAGKEQKTLRLIKYGAGSAFTGGFMQLSTAPEWMSSVHLKSSNNTFLLRAEKASYGTVEMAVNAEPTPVELDMERSNSVELKVLGTFRNAVEKTIRIEKDGRSEIITTPRLVTLESGIYRITGDHDITSAIDEFVEIPSTDTLLVMRVDNIHDLLPSRNITVMTDSHTKATDSIMAKNGGNISLTTENGDQFILEIAAGGLFNDEEITLASISEVTDLPFSGGFVAGVEFQPSGLQLAKLAKLRYIPAEPFSDDAFTGDESGSSLTGFGYFSSGEDFHLHSFHTRENEIIFNIGHFSGLGIGGANHSDRQSQQKHQSQKNDANASQQMQDILDDYQKRNRSNPKAELTEQETAELLAILRRWYYNSVEPMLREAMTDEKAFICAFVEYVNWGSAFLQVDELLGYPFPGPLQAEADNARDMLRIALNYAKEQRMQMAIDNYDIRQFHYIIELGKINMSLFGGGGFDREILNLLRFEVDFESRIQNEDIWVVSVQTERFVIQYDWTSTKGHGAIYHTDAQMDCMVEFEGTSDVFHVYDIFISIPFPDDFQCGDRTINGDSKKKQEPDVVMFYNPGLPMEKFIIQCDEEDDRFPLGPMSLWTSTYLSCHEEYITPDFGLALHQWELFFGELFAIKQVNRSTSHFIENTKVTLWYAPMP